MRTRTWLYAIAGITVLLLAGCAPGAEQEPVPQLAFEAPIAINADRESHIRLGVRNVDTQDLPGDERFEGRMEIREAAGTLRASAEVELPAIPAGDTEWLMEWRGELAPGDYRLTWGSDRYGFTTVEFTVVERDGRLYLAENTPPEEATDKAERLAAQAIADLASRLGIGAG